MRRYRGAPLCRPGALAAAVPHQARHAVRLSAWRVCRSRCIGRDAAGERLSQIKDYYDARRDALGRPVPYKPLGPDKLYFGPEEWRRRLESRFPYHAVLLARRARGDCGGRPATQRAAEDATVPDAVVRHIRELRRQQARLVGLNDGSRDARRCSPITAARPGRIPRGPKSEIHCKPASTHPSSSPNRISWVTPCRSAEEAGTGFPYRNRALSPATSVCRAWHRPVRLQARVAAGAPSYLEGIPYAGGDKLFLQFREPRTPVALRLQKIWRPAPTSSAVAAGEA